MAGEPFDNAIAGKQIFALFGTNGQKHHEKFVLATVTSMICGIIMCSLYYCYKKWRNKRRIHLTTPSNADLAPLIQK